ncbi:hypothetical protein BDW75DRAFT_19708 [Aspergillus navahoensis]
MRVRAADGSSLQTETTTSRGQEALPSDGGRLGTLRVPRPRAGDEGPALHIDASSGFMRNGADRSG